MADDTNKPQGGEADKPAAPAPGTPEYDKAMADKGAAAAGEQPSGDKPQKPAGIPDKFWDAEKGAVRVEDLAKSYAELEKKQGAPAVDPAKTAEAEAAAQKAGVDFDKLNAEFSEKGKLSDESYAELEKKGFNREAVDTYIEGQKAKAAAYDNTAYTTAGGPDAFKAMVSWAVTGIDEAGQKAFNAAVSSGDEGKMKLAVFELRQKYEAANGKAPGLITGNQPGARSDVYRSLKELSADMKDPRYKSDPAYRADVEAKANRSTL